MRGKRIEEALGRIERAMERVEARECVWREVAAGLAKEKSELLDRLMSRGLDEFKTYTFVPEEQKVPRVYDPAEDSANAGMVTL